ncbi:hypothetical protein EC396_16550 [Lutibacter sp. HS1-25]|uniref:ion channel n=1 Tax=Lutibacter sp. HS1-25 TaxID=2485000 RepID=UPI001011B66C|nr:ion channel [Lutibacter sp. HS1-25]RXP44771.1 hypothetical protein EC396_16550 [Lutibacter sp. HS1-25]
MMLNKDSWFEDIYKFRFEIFFISLLSILFSGIFFPENIFNIDVAPFLYLINAFSGILVVFKSKKNINFAKILLIVIFLHFIISFFLKQNSRYFEVFKLIAFSVFYVLITYDLIKQVLLAAIIDRNVIFGLMCGYFCIGLVCSFMFITIEIFYPGSFNGVVSDGGYIKEYSSLVYFSYITLLTIGFGDITPITLLAKKATLLTGFMGQFYMVILTAIIVGKYISQLDNERREIE